jgi:hypothetical protein
LLGWFKLQSILSNRNTALPIARQHVAAKNISFATGIRIKGRHRRLVAIRLPSTRMKKTKLKKKFRISTRPHGRSDKAHVTAQGGYSAIFESFPRERIGVKALSLSPDAAPKGGRTS